MASRKGRGFPTPDAPDGFAYAVGESGAPELTPIEDVVAIPVLDTVANERGDGSYMTPLGLAQLYAREPARRPARVLAVLPPGTRRHPAFPNDPPCRFAWVEFQEAGGRKAGCVLRDDRDAASPWWAALPAADRAALRAAVDDPAASRGRLV